MRLTLNCCSMLHDMRNCNYGACTPMHNKVFTKMPFYDTNFCVCAALLILIASTFLHLYNFTYISEYILTIPFRRVMINKKKRKHRYLLESLFTFRENTFGFGSLIWSIKKSSMQIKTCWIVFELWRLGCVNCKCIYKH